MATSRQQEDTEITLTTGKVLTLFFALSAVCAVFFALGFLFGKNSAKELPAPSPASQPGVSAHVDPPKPSAGPPAAGSGSATQANSTDATASAPISVQTDAPTSHDSTAPSPPPDTTQLPGSGYYVQVAAVSKQEDADALIDALKKKQYPAFLPDSTADKLFHVQIGPFSDIKGAEGIRTRLLNDGYSPIIKR